MKQTTNYQLPQWEETDRILMKDFNDMTGKIDGGLAAKCEVVMGTYNPGSIQEKTPYHVSLGFRPKAVLIWYNEVDHYAVYFHKCALVLDGRPVKVSSLNQSLAEIEDDGFWVQYIKFNNGSYHPDLADPVDYMYIALK